MAASKICLKCRVRKPLKDFYKNSSSQDGRHYNCKSCTYTQTLPAKFEKMRKAEKKPCSNCHKVLPFNSFYKDSSRVLGLGSECKDCVRERAQHHADRKRTHEQKARLRERAWRAEMKAKGLCTRCGKNPLESGTSCEGCLTRLRQRQRQQTAEWRAAGKCYRCGGEIGTGSLCDGCRQQERRKVNEAQQRLRNEVIDYLGAECACCGETIRRFLQLDHVNGRAVPGGDHLTRGQLRKVLAGVRTDIRVLCVNCNFGREQNGGICPHAEAGTSKIKWK